MKEKNIFFLIEHQSKVDYSMPYRLEEYRIEIIKSAIDIEKIKNKGYEIPEVIPIVIYTGKGNWNAKLHLHSIQDKRFKNVNLQKYNLIDINKYEEETLIKSRYLIDKIFLIEKAIGKEKLEQAIREAIETTKDEDKQKLIRLIQTTLKVKLGKDKLKELTKSEEGEYEIMEEILDRVIRYERKTAKKEGKIEGKIEGIKSIINNMLQQGLEVSDINKLTGVTIKKIEQIKKEIGN